MKTTPIFFCLTVGTIWGLLSFSFAGRDNDLDGVSIAVL